MLRYCAEGLALKEIADAGCNPFSSKDHVRVREMTLRDGLQSFPRTLRTAAKIEIYNLLVSLGLKNFKLRPS